MKLEVLAEHFEVPKRTQFGTIMRSTGQDKIYVKNEEGIWKHVGFLMHASMSFVGLVDFPKELGPLVADELTKQKKAKVRFGGAPESIVEAEESEEEDES